MPDTSGAAPVPPFQPEQNEELQTVTCPNCGVTLQKVAVSAGAKIHCTNCAKTFSLASPEPAGVLADHLPVREPGSPGYWLLRIPTIILFAAGCSGLLLFVYFILIRGAPRVNLAAI